MGVATNLVMDGHVAGNLPGMVSSSVTHSCWSSQLRQRDRVTVGEFLPNRTGCVVQSRQLKSFSLHRKHFCDHFATISNTGSGGASSSATPIEVCQCTARIFQ